MAAVSADIRETFALPEGPSRGHEKVSQLPRLLAGILLSVSNCVKFAPSDLSEIQV
jgi:hypothetical protein